MLLMGLKDSTKKMVSKGAHVFNQYKVNKILELLEFETHFGRKKTNQSFSIRLHLQKHCCLVA